MSAQLDILALEPFYGGVRRVMLDTLIHGSRHRWTLLKLPPRRLERRLTAAAHWFAEQLSRHWVGHVDLVFTSEALNLSDLRRLMSPLLHVPAVVYFHDNQLPLADAIGQTPTDLINLNSAAAANEIWFNSKFHLAQFLSRAESLVRRHPELISRSPMSSLRSKATVFPPPIDMTAVHASADQGVVRSKRNIFVDLNGANIDLLNETFATLLERGEQFCVMALGGSKGGQGSNQGNHHGSQGQLAADVSVTYLDEFDDGAAATAMRMCGIFLGACSSAFCDYQAMRAMAAGCWPLVPVRCGYEEIIPEPLHSATLYEPDAEQLVERLQDVFHLEQIGGYDAQQRLLLRPFDPSIACRRIDERLSEMLSNATAVAGR